MCCNFLEGAQGRLHEVTFEHKPLRRCRKKAPRKKEEYTMAGARLSTRGEEVREWPVGLKRRLTGLERRLTTFLLLFK